MDVLYAYDSSMVTMTAGTVTSSLVAHDFSAITMNGGVVDTRAQQRRSWYRRA